MKIQSIDTDPNAEKVLISLLRKASISKKFYQVRSLSQMTIQLSKRAIKRANENLNEEEVDLLFINLHYGQGLAERVKDYMRRIHYEKS